MGGIGGADSVTGAEVRVSACRSLTVHTLVAILADAGVGTNRVVTSDSVRINA